MSETGPVTRETFSSALEGGFIEQYSLDLAAKTFMMRVEVLDASVLTSYQVLFVGVSVFDFRDEPAREWERLELTEIRIEEVPEKSGTEEWAVWVNLWDAAQLTVKCAAIQVDEAPLR